MLFYSVLHHCRSTFEELEYIFMRVGFCVHCTFANNYMNVACKIGKWLPILQSAGKRQHNVSFVYRSYHLPMPDPSPSTLTDSLNSNFLQLGRRSGGRSQRAIHPMRLPVNTVIHTTLVGLEPATFRSLVRRATSSATEPTTVTVGLFLTCNKYQIWPHKILQN